MRYGKSWNVIWNYTRSLHYYHVSLCVVSNMIIWIESSFNGHYVITLCLVCKVNYRLVWCEVSVHCPGSLCCGSSVCCGPRGWSPAPVLGTGGTGHSPCPSWCLFWGWREHGHPAVPQDQGGRSGAGTRASGPEVELWRAEAVLERKRRRLLC